MTWHLPNAEYEKFARNTIVSVVLELTYHPILAIETNVLVATFQGKVRDQLPRYSKESGQRIEVSSFGVKSSDQISHRFQSTDSNCMLALSKDGISLTIQNHQSRDITVGLFEKCVSSLADALGPDPIDIKRLGVRYVNVINRQKISTDLGKDVAWNDLVSDNYFNFPNNVVDSEKTLFSAEINSPLTRGGMILRYGLLPMSSDKLEEPVFRFDADRYLDQSININEVTSSCNGLVTDVFNVFSSMKGPVLEGWMRGESNGGV